MKKINTHARQVVIQQDGFQVKAWIKVCPVCGKEYTTTVRSQKFCSVACGKKQQKRKRKQQKEYNSSKEIQRLAARSHAVAVEVVKQLTALSLIEYKCELCGATENLQVHHHNLKWLDNSLENLTVLCPACHASEHSRIEALMKSTNTSLQDIYTEKEWEIYSKILKR